MAYYKKQFNEKAGVYYPQAVVMGKHIETKKIADRLARISTVSYADVMAVLAELPGVMADYMAQGKSVQLEGLGTFRYTLKTKGVSDEAAFDFQQQVEAVRVQFIPTKEGGTTKGSTATRALVPSDIEWINYDGKEDSAGGNTEEPGTEPGTGGDGEDEDLFG